MGANELVPRWGITCVTPYTEMRPAKSVRYLPSVVWNCRMLDCCEKLEPLFGPAFERLKCVVTLSQRFQLNELLSMIFVLDGGIKQVELDNSLHGF